MLDINRQIIAYIRWVVKHYIDYAFFMDTQMDIEMTILRYLCERLSSDCPDVGAFKTFWRKIKNILTQLFLTKLFKEKLDWDY